MFCSLLLVCSVCCSFVTLRVVTRFDRRIKPSNPDPKKAAALFPGKMKGKWSNNVFKQTGVVNFKGWIAMNSAAGQSCFALFPDERFVVVPCGAKLSIYDCFNPTKAPLVYETGLKQAVLEIAVCAGETPADPVIIACGTRDGELKVFSVDAKRAADVKQKENQVKNEMELAHKKTDAAKAAAEAALKKTRVAERRLSNTDLPLAEPEVDSAENGAQAAAQEAQKEEATVMAQNEWEAAGRVLEEATKKSEAAELALKEAIAESKDIIVLCLLFGKQMRTNRVVFCEFAPSEVAHNATDFNTGGSAINGPVLLWADESLFTVIKLDPSNWDTSQETVIVPAVCSTGDRLGSQAKIQSKDVALVGALIPLTNPNTVILVKASEHAIVIRDWNFTKDLPSPSDLSVFTPELALPLVKKCPYLVW